MNGPYALLDSNVLVAILAVEHQHHARSIHLARDRGGRRFAVAAHSYAETYSTLTRRGAGVAYRKPPQQAWWALERVSEFTILLGLSPAETVETVRSYAASGGVGPRLHDRLIGEVAVRRGISMIVTWDTGHYRDLFPQLTVVEPPALTDA